MKLLPDHTTSDGVGAHGKRMFEIEIEIEFLFYDIPHCLFNRGKTCHVSHALASSSYPSMAVILQPYLVPSSSHDLVIPLSTIPYRPLRANTCIVPIVPIIVNRKSDQVQRRRGEGPSSADLQRLSWCAFLLGHPVFAYVQLLNSKSCCCCCCCWTRPRQRCSPL